MQNTWMIYGANGYTGRLIAEEAKRRKLNPILAGRSKQVEELGQKLGFKTRLFSLDTPAEVAAGLKDVSAVLHCAGPFSATSQKMLDGCILAKTHYFDITGEIDVFEQVHARNEELKKAGIAAVPGVGFDVVPTDCLAAMLKKQMPDATNLRLAFKVDGGPSAGTAKTSIEGAAKGGKVRVNSKIVSVHHGAKTMKVTFEDRPVLSMLIPWGDVSTAFYSTGIPNIEVYMASSKAMVRFSGLIGRAAKLPFFEPAMKRLISKTIKGPSPELLKNGHAWVWGEVQNRSGKALSRRIKTPQGYALTVDSSLVCIQKVLSSGIAAGALTPSQAFGPEFVFELRGVTSL